MTLKNCIRPRCLDEDGLCNAECPGGEPSRDATCGESLLPCPFCGGEATARDLAGWEIYCGCGADLVLHDDPSREGVVKAWNRRSAIAMLAEETTRSEIARPCTCHPDDNPPVPCPKKYALTECREAALSATRLKKEQVEWVVNDIAELGVKIGDQFFWLYKGTSLVYGGYEDSEQKDGVCLHDNGGPMHWRPVGKREFGECCHPVNYKEPEKWGTVSLDDSDEWKPLPVSAVKYD